MPMPGAVRMWVWHAFGDLALDGIKDGEITHGQWSATWLDPEDDIGLQTTMLGSAPRGGTKVSIRANEFGSYLRVFRGNYGESFDRHIGPDTPIGLERGLNAQWTEGGLMYSPPFK